MSGNDRHRLIRSIGLLIIILFTILAPVAAQDGSTTHTVQRGETLFRIAQRYGVSMDAIIQANGLTNPSRILVGQQLVIPGFDPSPSVVDNPMVAGTPVYHTVQPGETLASIAAQYGMTVEQIIQINNIANPNRILRGQQLTVWATTNVEPSIDDPAAAQVNVTETTTIDPAAAPVETAPQSISYVVQAGEHLAEIARRFGVTWTEIAQANGLSNPNQIFAGQTLLIPATTGVSDMGILEAPLTPLVAPAMPTIFEGRQVVVDLSDQMTYAYENGVLVRSVLVSTGLPGTPTVQGDYTVYRKYAAQTMSGPGYYLPDVPYVMYFYQGYALHGTYWHNNFGNPMSHGCVNMPTPESEWFFNNFVDIGTPVHVQY